MRMRIIILIGLATVVAAAATPDAPEQMRQLTARVLADPLDAAAQKQLLQLKEQREANIRTGFGALARGLEALLQGDAGRAVEQLETAAALPHARHMAESMLPRGLADYIKQNKGKAARPLCPDCGNSGIRSCPAPSCFGTGAVYCKACRGYAITGTRRCKKCNGIGATPCPTCQGAGLKPCHCSRPFTAEESTAIRQTIARARHMHQGGLDLDAPGALERPPALAVH